MGELDLIGKISLDISQYKQALRQGGDQTVLFGKLVDRTSNNISKSMVGMGNSVGKGFNKIGSMMTQLMSGPLAALGGAFAALEIGKGILQAAADYRKVHAALTIISGSADMATHRMQELDNAFIKSSINVDDATDAYQRFLNAGIDLTIPQLRAIGDLAITSGKSFDEMANAVFLAAEGSTRALKQFGITAVKDGDQLQMTFRGVTTEIDNNATAITNYIVKVGQMQGVTGAAQAQLGTVAGQLVYLKNNFSELFEVIGLGTEGPIMAMVRGLNMMIEDMRILASSTGIIDFFKRLNAVGNGVLLGDSKERDAIFKRDSATKAPLKKGAATRAPMTGDNDGAIAAAKYAAANPKKTSGGGGRKKTGSGITSVNVSITDAEKAREEAIQDAINFFRNAKEDLIMGPVAEALSTEEMPEFEDEAMRFGDAWVEQLTRVNDAKDYLFGEMYNAFAHGIESIIKHGVSGFKDLGKAIKDSIIQMIAAQAAAAALQAILSVIGIGGGGGGGGKKKKRKGFFGKLFGTVLDIGGAVLGGLLPFANGGIVKGPTQAMIGEYPGAKHNPEVVAPLSDLKNILAGAGGMGGGQVNFVLRGQDLHGTLNRYNNSKKR